MTLRGLFEMTTSVLVLSRRPETSASPLARCRPLAVVGDSRAVRRAAVSRDLVDDARYLAAIAKLFLFGGARVVVLNRAERRAYVALHQSALFDADWYVTQNPDVATSGVDPLHHLVRYGIGEGRAPTPGIRARHPFPTSSSAAPSVDDRYFEIVAPLRRSLDEDPTAGAKTPTTEKGYLRRFSDASVSRALRRFERFPLFREEDYLALNEELRDECVRPRHHALAYGFAEGRTVFARRTIANDLGLRSRQSGIRPFDAAEPRTEGLSLSILYNSAGNTFLRDIADDLLYDLRNDGHDAALLTERDEIGDLREHAIIVGPHEFFFVGEGAAWARDDVLARAIMYNTEQPQTVWFARAVPHSLLSRGVVDLSGQVASIYAEAMPAIHCDPVGAALADRLPRADDSFLRILPLAARRIGSREGAFEERCIDVSFFGGISDHRERFLTQTARFFSDFKTLFYCRRDTGPIRVGAPVDLVAAARHVGFHSKIVLNLHRDEFGFFEWHRIVRLGIETGAVVVSEPCLPHPDFKPNTHYFEESGRHIQNLVEWLLKTSEGQAQAALVRRNALELVDRKRKRKQAGRRIARFIDSLDGCRA